MCTTRRVKYDYEDEPAHAHSLVHIARDALKMEFCNSWQDREMRGEEGKGREKNGDREKRKEKESGKCRPPGTQQQFIQPAC